MLKKIYVVLLVFIVCSFNVYGENITFEEYEKFDLITDEIQKELKYIDDKLEDIRDTKEFEKYPAIRLNVDTPMFGISSIINSKLKIKDNVNAYDIASGYGVETIIKSNIVKVPSFDVASIVVITRDIKISEDMSKDDAYIAMTKLMEAYVKVKDVSEFLDNQSSNIFSDYYSDDKVNIINDIILSLKDTKVCLDEISEIIPCFDVLGINKDYNIYYDNLKKYEEFKDATVDIFITEDELKETLDSVKDFNKELDDLLLSMQKEYVKEYEEADYKECLNILHSIINERVEDLNKYEDLIPKNNYTFSSDLNYIKDKEVSIYEDIDNFDSDVKIYDINDKHDISGLVDIYLDFLVRENTLYTNIISFNVKDIKKGDYLDLSKFEYVKFLNIDMLEVLDEVYLKYYKNNILSNIKSIDSLTFILDNIFEIQDYISEVKEQRKLEENLNEDDINIYEETNEEL